MSRSQICGNYTSKHVPTDSYSAQICFCYFYMNIGVSNTFFMVEGCMKGIVLDTARVSLTLLLCTDDEIASSLQR